MILLVGSIVIALIIGGFVGYLIGSHGSKVIDGSIQDVKDRVDQVHTKAESIKDDLEVIEHIVNTVKDSVPDSAKQLISDGADVLSSKAVDFVEEQIKELDNITSKDKEETPAIAGEAVVGEAKAGESKVGDTSDVAQTATVDKPHGIVAG